MRGPRLPAGAGSPPSRFRCAAPGLSQSTGTPRVWVPGKLGSAGRGVCVCVCVGGCPPRAAPFGRTRVRVLSEDGGEEVAAGKAGGARRPRGVRPCCGVPGRGRGRAVTRQRRKEGVTPIPAARLPSPRPCGPLRRTAGPGAASCGDARGRPGCPGWRWPGLPGRVCPPRPGLDFLLRPARPQTFCGGRGGGERIASAAGKWRPGAGG